MRGPRAGGVTWVLIASCAIGETLGGCGGDLLPPAAGEESGDSDGATADLDAARSEPATGEGKPTGDDGGTDARPTGDDGGTDARPTGDDGGTDARPTGDDGGTDATSPPDAGTSAGQCTVDSEACFDGGLFACQIDGSWAPAWPYGCGVCPASGCGVVCSPGATQCSGNAVQACGANGEWAAPAPCPPPIPVCDQGACVARPSSCAAGDGGASCGPAAQLDEYPVVVVLIG